MIVCIHIRLRPIYNRDECHFVFKLPTTADLAK
jgi:hypothetical protein